MCQLLNVARSSYYAFCQLATKEPSKRQLENQILLEKIRIIFEKHKGRYGSPRIHKTLLQQGDQCSLGRVKRLMRAAGLYAISAKKYKAKQEKSEIKETRNLLLNEDNKPTAIN
jgi:transposase InsO family protein